MLIVLTLVLAVSSVLESVLIKYLSDAVIADDRKLFLLMLLCRARIPYRRYIFSLRTPVPCRSCRGADPE